MDNIRLEGTAYQYVTFPSGEALGGNLNIRRSKHTIKSPQRYDPGFRADREWKSDNLASIVYMIKYEDFNSNVDTNDILSLMDELYSEEYMYDP